jgi:AAA family ATP:ADP antiporter
VIGELLGHPVNSRGAPGVPSPTLYLIGQTFIYGFASTLLCTVANSLFLTKFGAEGLAHIYISLALFVPVVSFMYSASYRRFSSALIGLLTTALFMVLCFGGWALETRTSQIWAPYALLLGWNAYFLIGHLIQGDQIQRLFNVREVKKVVPVIMSGVIVGSILGGLMVTPLIDLVGSSVRLLLVTGCLLPLGLALQLYTIHRFPVLQGENKSAPEKREKKQRSLQALLGTRYVRLILIYGACYGLAIKLISYLFMSAAQQNTAGPEELSSLLGLAYSVGSTGSLVFVLFASSRLLNRFGLGVTLAGTPIIVAPLIIGAMAALFMADQSVSLYFGLVVTAFLMTHILDSGTTTTAMRTALQALPVSERPLAETAASGLGPSLAKGIAGVSILLLQGEASEGQGVILIFAFAICVCWTFASGLLYRDYGKLLLKTINRRALGSHGMEIADGHTLQVVEQYLESGDVRKARLGLEVLKEAEHPSYQVHVINTARSETPLLKALALEHIEQDRLVEALPLLEAELAQPATTAIQAASLRAYCSIMEVDAVDKVLPALDHSDLEVQAGALVGLVRYGGISGVLAAGERLFALQRAADPRQRMLLADVIEQVEQPSLAQLILPLLEDTNMEVRKRAFLAARKVRHLRVASALVEALSDGQVRSRAMMALSEMGDVLIPILKAALEEKAYPSSDVIKILRAIGDDESEAVISLLRRSLDHADRDIQTQVFRTLRSTHFRPSRQERTFLEKLLGEDVEHGLRLLKAQLVMEGVPALAPLRRSLGFELSEQRDRIFLILTFLRGAELIIQAEMKLVYGDSNERAIALESLEFILKGKVEGAVYTFVDTSESLQKRVDKLDQVFHSPSYDRDACLLEICLESENRWGKDWTRAWAIYGAWHLELFGDGEALKPCLNDSSPLIREAARRTLDALEIGTQSRRLARMHDSALQAWLAPTLLGEEERMLLTIEKVAILQNVELFAEAPDFALSAIAAIAEERHLEIGETFVQEGEQGDGMYVVVEGEVHLHAGGLTVTHLQPGGILGQIAIFDPGPRVVSATTVKESRVLWISKQAFREAMADCPEIAHASLVVLARRLRMVADQVDHLVNPS